jgi:hypothetical protein
VLSLYVYMCEWRGRKGMRNGRMNRDEEKRGVEGKRKKEQEVRLRRKAKKR